MSDTILIILIFMAGILLLACCVGACALIGRYYAGICARHADYCAEVDERVDLLMDEIVRVQNATTHVLPVARRDSEAPLRTRGQRQRASGRHAARPDPYDHVQPR